LQNGRYAANIGHQDGVFMGSILQEFIQCLFGKKSTLNYTVLSYIPASNTF
jgi:hypothetical protein